MSLDNFVLNCEKENKRLTIDLNYYKNCSNRLLIENSYLKEQLQQKEDIINKAKEYIKENTVGKKYGEEYYIDEFDRFAIPSGLIEILDNKGDE